MRSPLSLTRPLLGTTIAAVLLAATDAEASCIAEHELFLTPKASSRVPADPTIYVFAPGLRKRAPLHLRGWCNQDEIQPRIRSTSRVPAWTAWAVTADCAAGTLMLELGIGSGDETYRTTPSYFVREPRREHARLTLAAEKDAYHVHLFPSFAADAYLVRTARLWPTIGPIAEVIAPPSVADLFDLEAFTGRPQIEPPLVVLGSHDCLGTTIPDSALEGIVMAEIAPMFADGTIGPAVPLVFTRRWDPPRAVDLSGIDGGVVPVVAAAFVAILGAIAVLLRASDRRLPPPPRP